MHRFANGPIRSADGSLRWPFDEILRGLEDGIRSCARLAPEGVRSLAVDGWAVDYVRLDDNSRALEEPFCYRDERTLPAAAALHARVAPEHLREVTGIEQQPLNTLYQLYADRLEGRNAVRWLNLPEYCLHRWGAEPIAEYTNASHTELVDLYARNWSREIFRAAELEITCAPRIVPPGTLLGKLTGPLAGVHGLHDVELIAHACHDTASAIAGIAETDDDWAYISCGTWSLVGTLTRGTVEQSPLCARITLQTWARSAEPPASIRASTAMWMLKQCTEHWSGTPSSWELTDLLNAAEAQPAPGHLLRVDDPSLLGMGDMPGRINAQLAAADRPPLPSHRDAAPAIVSLLLHSLAARYAQVLERVRVHSGKPLRRIVMVGGGAQNAMLRRLTAQKTGLPVVMGPAESSTIGNLAVQLAVLEGSDPGFRL